MSNNKKESTKYGVLVVNLGTPDEPKTASVKAYLKQFLSDVRVIDYPRWLWAMILNLIILPIRSPKVAKLYQQIWLPEGSPLRVYTQQLSDELQTQLQQTLSAKVQVEMAMTYGSPSMTAGMQKLLSQGIKHIVVLPLYPQYSATTTAAVFDALADTLRQVRHLPNIRFINNYYDNSAYIDALADSIRQFRANAKVKADLLLFSFHGLPERYIKLGDPYQYECEQTAQLVAAALGLNEQQWMISYQSRVGKEQWLTPYTDQRLIELAGQGVRSIDVVCPAFATDCLETLEEIAVENRDYFITAGGEHYQYIPALNAGKAHVEALSGIIRRQIEHWD